MVDLLVGRPEEAISCVSSFTRKSEAHLSQTGRRLTDDSEDLENIFRYIIKRNGLIRDSTCVYIWW